MSYGLDLSPAQAPLNCFGSARIISRDRLSSRILARLRPRHYRKADYNERLRRGDAHMTEASELFRGCQPSLSYEKRRSIQGHLDGLRIERDRLGKFSDYGGSQTAETDAISRAEAFQDNASRVRAMVAVSPPCPRVPHSDANPLSLSPHQQARKNSQVSLPNQHARASSTSVPHSRTSSPASRRVSNENSHPSGRTTHSSLSRVPTHHNEPLHMIQTRAGPVSWSPSPSPPRNALHLDLGYRASPRPPTMASTGTPMGSILSLDMPLAQFSPPRMSPVSLANGSPTDSVGAYSLGSDGFPRPSRRAAERRSTIQTTTSMSRSSAPSSRKSTQLSRTGTHSSLARQSFESAAAGRRSGTGSRAGSYQSQSQSHRPASQDGHGQRPYTRTPTSLRTSSVPPRHAPSPGSPYY
ncbi:hypothetical protein C8Q80DRAFT_874354 [Daedaleopsis nitida]|nr:hypothetical protein C8Q80DRAFT_874354 [Daedaleopsis nitida]